MAFDGLFTKAMVVELQALVSGRISKIHQPNNTEIVMHVRAGGENYRTLFSIHPSYARVHLTQETIQNPAEPPMFCMLMRKHIEGGFITKIEQLEMDRIIVFTIEATDEIGDKVIRELHMEVMGRHSNLLLVDPSRGTLIDTLKHVSMSDNRHRSLTPGSPYIAPPEQQKLRPTDVTEAQLIEWLQADFPAQMIMENIAGFSLLLAEELVYRLVKSATKQATYTQFLEALEMTPSGYVYLNGKKAIFASVALQHLQHKPQTFPNLGLMLDSLYFEKAERDRVKQQAGDLEKWLTNEIAKLRLKEKKLLKEQSNAEKLETFKQNGELITANLYRLEKGMKEAAVENYYEEHCPIVKIPLDVRKTPVENAQAFYTRYNKAKTALIKTEEQLQKTAEDIAYLELVLQQLMQASPEDIIEIREELAEEGWLKARKSKHKKKPTKPTPEKYVSSAGLLISVGKNNKQNDFVTFKLGKRSELWFHTKDIPGSHVVLHGDSVDDTSIIEAAKLAAYFSKARDSSSVPVDYTEIRHVKKPSGSKPGFVIYFEQKTVFVTPDVDVVRELRK